MKRKMCLVWLGVSICIQAAFAIDHRVSASSPADFNRAGIQLAEMGHLPQAMQKFKLALELNPSSAEYLNNMGVALMRMGNFEDALENFEQALKREPGHVDATDNKRYLQSNLMQKATHTATSSLRLKPRKRLPRIHLNDLYSTGFEDFANGLRPFVLIGATESWNLFRDSKQWDINYFRENFGNYTADFYPHNMRRSNVRPFLIKMANALDEFENPSGAYPTDNSSPGTYIQWNVPVDAWEKLREDIDPLPQAFRFDENWMAGCMPNNARLQDEYSLKLHWRMVLIGTENAGMFFHMDVLNGSSWQAQIQGAKRWTLCDPVRNRGRLYSAGQVDTFAPDLDRFPEFAESECYDDEVHAGEMLFYPQEYWHQTRNLATPTVTISGTVIDGNNRDAVENELQSECDRGKWNWHFSEELCSQLQTCYSWWRQHTSTKQPYGSIDSQTGQDEGLSHDEL